MDYDDEHRLFVQGMMSRGIASANEVTSLFNIVNQRCDVEMPSDPDERRTLLAQFIRTINDQLRALDFEIVKILDEDECTRVSYYAFVNKNDISKTATMSKLSLCKYAPHELEYLQLVADAIMTSKMHEITAVQALNIAPRVKTKAMRQQEAEEILDCLLQDKWLRTTDGSVRFAPRFLAEMERYLKHTYGDYIKACTMCKRPVFRPVTCALCAETEVNYHLYCISSRVRSGGSKPTCPSCHREIQVKLQSVAGSKRRCEEICDNDDV